MTSFGLYIFFLNNGLKYQVPKAQVQVPELQAQVQVQVPRSQVPKPIDGVKQVQSAKLLGVIFQSTVP